MQIRIGYELVYDCPQPTPMLLMLNVHASRAADLVVPDRLATDPRGSSNSRRRAPRASQCASRSCDVWLFYWLCPRPHGRLAGGGEGPTA